MLMINERFSISIELIFNRSLIVFLSIFLFSGCGGGTIGTDSGGTTKVAGQLVTSSGEKVPGASVTIAESGDQTITDQDGEFEIDTPITQSTVTFLVEVDGVSLSSFISDVPLDPEKLAVVLELNLNEQSVIVATSEVTPRTSPAPQPSNVPERKVDVIVNMSGLGVLSQASFLDFNRDTSLFIGGGHYAPAYSKIKVSRSSFIGMELRTPFGRGNISLEGLEQNLQTIEIDATFYIRPSATGYDWVVYPTKVLTKPTAKKQPTVLFSPGGSGPVAPDYYRPDLGIGLEIIFNTNGANFLKGVSFSALPPRTLVVKSTLSRYMYLIQFAPGILVPPDFSALLSSASSSFNLDLGVLSATNKIGYLTAKVNKNKEDGELSAVVISSSVF